MKSATEQYAELVQLSKEIATFGTVQGLLEWDQETHMPPGALQLRQKQLSLLAHLVHKKKSSSTFAKALSRLIDLQSGEIIDATLSPAQVSALKEWRRDYLKLKKLPASFVKTFTETTSAAQAVWAEAKKRNNFKQFQPHLEKILSLCRKKADLLGFSDHPYDALLDLYEPEMCTATLNTLFGKLKLPLTLLLKEIGTKGAVDTSFLGRDYPLHKQREFGQLLLQKMGFSPETSRLDFSHHPFCMGLSPLDTRMTSRLFLNNPMSHIFSVIHEGGHGLYNMGLPIEHFGTPLGEQVSLGIDESQSRFWETLIARSLPFWHHFFPLLQHHFPEQLQDVSVEDFFCAINAAHPTLIRVDADEVSYSLHIILRFEIEKRLIEGALSVEEIPELWNEWMRELLGIVPKGYSDGCLQDIHWAFGSFGYFPTYTLGNLYACQLFSAFVREHPTWQIDLAKGELSFIRKWLQEKIHKHGRQYGPEELIQRATGSPLSEKFFLDYLDRKYRPLYRL